GNSGGIPDAVRDGETGILVPPEDPAALGRGLPRARRPGARDPAGTERAARGRDALQLGPRRPGSPRHRIRGSLLAHCSRHVMDDVRWFAPNRFCTLVVPRLRDRGLVIALDGDRPARLAIAT